MDYWRGEIAIFREFKNDIRDFLKEGKIGEVKKLIPIFKIYKKGFLRLIEQEDKKDLKIKEEDYKKIQNTGLKENWDSEKKLPAQPLAQGLLTQDQYDIAHLLNGFRTAEDISSEMNLPIEEVYTIFKTIDDLGLLEYIELI